MDLGEELKQEGITQAIESADRRVTDWSTSAYNILRRFLNICKGSFMGEDVRSFAEGYGLEEPPSARAWGAVILRAKREGLIKFVGYGQVNNPKAHKANASIWVRNG